MNPERQTANLGLVPQLRVIRGGQSRREYLNKQHAAGRACAAKAINARQRMQGERPDDLLYRASSNQRKPLGPVFQQIEATARLRDQAPADADLTAFNEAMQGWAWVVFDFAMDAIDASDRRRARHTDQSA